MKDRTHFLCAVLAILATALPTFASAQTKTVNLWSGQLKLAVPKTAGKTKKISSTLFSIQPTAKKSRIVLYASREPVLADETTLTNPQLADSIKGQLEAQGYTVSSLTSKNNTFSAKLTGYASMPWRKVGSSSIRGLAQFVRTSNRQLVGAIVLSDPSEWNKKPTRDYRSAATKIQVK
jgi:hypothetical protein